MAPRDQRCRARVERPIAPVLAGNDAVLVSLWRRVHRKLTSGHGKRRPRTVRLRFAFATDRDASLALGLLRASRQLVRRAVRRQASSETEVAVLDLVVAEENAQPATTLAMGAHGVPIDRSSQQADTEGVATPDGVVLT